MIFDRRLYLDYLVSCEGNGMIKIITGIRRCGKSHLLFTLYKQHLLKRGIKEDHIIEVDAFRKVIIVGGYHIPHHNEHGVLITGVFDFLLDENGLEKV